MHAYEAMFYSYVQDEDRALDKELHDGGGTSERGTCIGEKHQEKLPLNVF